MNDLTRRRFLVGAGAVGGVALVGAVAVRSGGGIDGGTAESTGPDQLDAGGVSQGWSTGRVDGGGA